MQIIIDIPDGYVGVIMKNQRMEGSVMDKLIRQAIIDGIQLPKGHGDLVDRDRIISDGVNKGFCDWYDEIKYADTIIKADKGE